MFNLKDNKMDKIIKIIKGQSNKSYLTEISYTFPTRNSMPGISLPLWRHVPRQGEELRCPAFPSELPGYNDVYTLLKLQIA